MLDPQPQLVALANATVLCATTAEHPCIDVELSAARRHRAGGRVIRRRQVPEVSDRGGKDPVDQLDRGREKNGIDIDF